MNEEKSCKQCRKECISHSHKGRTQAVETKQVTVDRKETKESV